MPALSSLIWLFRCVTRLALLQQALQWRHELLRLFHSDRRHPPPNHPLTVPSQVGYSQASSTHPAHQTRSLTNPHRPHCRPTATILQQSAGRASTDILVPGLVRRLLPARKSFGAGATCTRCFAASIGVHTTLCAPSFASACHAAPVHGMKHSKPVQVPATHSYLLLTRSLRACGMASVRLRLGSWLMVALLSCRLVCSNCARGRGPPPHNSRARMHLMTIVMTRQPGGASTAPQGV
jgi:hypothetical protein